MYYKIYGVMHQSGFNTELFNTNTMGKATSLLGQIDPRNYPYFAITEHLRPGAPAIAIYPGVTKDGVPSIAQSLVDYRPNPMENFEIAARLFSTLGARAQAELLAENQTAAGSTI